METVLVVVILAAFGLFGAVIGSGKQVGQGAGFVLCVLLGPLGLIIVLASARKHETVLDRVQARPTAEGWHADPLGRFDGRYFDGERWTQHVGRVLTDGTRQQFEDPI